MKAKIKPQKKCHFCGKKNSSVKPRQFGFLLFKVYCCNECK